MSARDVRIALIHLGCARNLIDSETILGRLGSEGYQLTGAVEDADVAILNTCSFIGPARRESEQAIAGLLERKQEGDLQGVMVVGCLPQKFYEKTVKDFPDVDAFLGLSDYSSVARVVESVLKGQKVQPGAGGRVPRSQPDTDRLLQTPRSYAYLRPSNGCDHHCAFCIIPSIRGRQRSKPVEVVVAEAQALAEGGVREVVMVAEDSTGYGKDLGPDGPRLPDVVEAMAPVPGLARIRVMYAYPNAFPWRLTEVMRDHDNVVPYLDIPMQHASTPVLKRMRRGGTGETVRDTLRRLRQEVEGIALRTTVLVGHPGEGPAEFEELLTFLEEMRFERLGAFSFSPESGTPAGKETDRCTSEEGQERLRRVMEAQAAIHAEHQRGRIGQQLDVLIDEIAEGTAIGRTEADAPEVDGVVKVEDPDGQLQVADLIKVEITGADDYDLSARQLGR